jgi:hypothetical protein
MLYVMPSFFLAASLMCRTLVIDSLQSSDANYGIGWSFYLATCLRYPQMRQNK